MFERKKAIYLLFVGPTVKKNIYFFYDFLCKLMFYSTIKSLYYINVFHVYEWIKTHNLHKK